VWEWLMNTTLDLFEAATMSLTRPTPIKDRLTDAYRNYLAYVDQDDLPADVCEEFRALTDTLTRVSPELRGDDALHATIRKMSPSDAAAVASAVVRIFGAVARASTSPPHTDAADLDTGAKNIGNVVPLQVAKA
jgi:hypothetical protein